MKYVKCDLELMKRVFDESKKITRKLYPVERVHVSSLRKHDQCIVQVFVKLLKRKKICRKC